MLQFYSRVLHWRVTHSAGVTTPSYAADCTMAANIGSIVKFRASALPAPFQAWWKRANPGGVNDEAFLTGRVEGASVAWLKVRIPAAEGRMSGLAIMRRNTLTIFSPAPLTGPAATQQAAGIDTHARNRAVIAAAEEDNDDSDTGEDDPPPVDYAQLTTVRLGPND